MTDRYEQISWYRMIGDGYEPGKFFVRMSEQRVPVKGWDEALGYVSIADGDDPEDRIPRYIVERFGRFERRVPEHPHGIVPQDVGTAIQFGDGRRAMRIQAGLFGWAITENGPVDSDWDWEYTETVQALADQHGFTALGDVEAAREEGRKAGIRAVYDFLAGRYGAHSLAQRIRNGFPKAFEDGESDD